MLEGEVRDHDVNYLVRYRQRRPLADDVSLIDSRVSQHHVVYVEPDDPIHFPLHDGQRPSVGNWVFRRPAPPGTEINHSHVGGQQGVDTLIELDGPINPAEAASGYLGVLPGQHV